MAPAKPERISGDEMARRMGVASLTPLIADADRRPTGPNRAQRRAAARWKASR